MITDEQREARRQGRLDQRCRSCGTTSAATSYCCHCHGHDLEYRIHLPSWSPKRRDLPRVVQWCEQDNTPRTADPVRRAAALAPRCPVCGKGERHRNHGVEGSHRFAYEPSPQSINGGV